MNVAMVRVILFCFSCVLFGTVSAQVSETERDALIDFYNATGGDQWDNNQGWLSSPGSECNWHGVQCASPDGDHFVLRLMLPDNNLTGQLPSSLAGLDRLRTLTLHGNRISGTLPTDLWGLSRLDGLSLSGNQFTGPVPAAILGMPQGAPQTWVHLAGNQLDGFGRVDVPHSPGIEIYLNLSGNHIDELPPAQWRATGAIETLELANNRLEGGLAFAKTPWPGLERLDLSGNTIAGLTGLDGSILPELQTLNVRGNRLEAVPESLTTLGNLTDLDASNNQLVGELPEWFEQLNLARLGLDNNDLSGPIARVFDAMNLATFPRQGPHGNLGLTLHVANNRFHGTLPDVDFAAFNTPAQGQSPEFGLDLCFNDIDIPDAETLTVIDGVHRGHALAPCLGREQMGIDPTISGSWYQPNRDGEGLTQMLMDNGLMLTYWFTYTPPENNEPPEQMWLFGVSEPGESWSELRPLWTTSGGRFDQGLMGSAAEPSGAWMRQNRLDADTLHFLYDYRGRGFCITGGCFWETMTERFDLTRLTHMAGTNCDNQTTVQQYSGAWYNPERNGEGFVVEALPDDRAVVYWFTHTPDGSGQQAWMIGVGKIESPITGTPPPNPPTAVLSVEPLHQPIGATFGPDFDPAAVEMREWGDLVVEFLHDGTGHIFWDSNLEDYGSGDYPIERLARPKLAECD